MPVCCWKFGLHPSFNQGCLCIYETWKSCLSPIPSRWSQHCLKVFVLYIVNFVVKDDDATLGLWGKEIKNKNVLVFSRFFRTKIASSAPLLLVPLTEDFIHASLEEGEIKECSLNWKQLSFTRRLQSQLSRKASWNSPVWGGGQVHVGGDWKHPKWAVSLPPSFQSF